MSLHSSQPAAVWSLVWRDRRPVVALCGAVPDRPGTAAAPRGEPSRRRPATVPAPAPALAPRA